MTYSDIVVPLTRLTQKDAPWNFSEDCQCSFNWLKEAFTTAPILTHYQPGAPITVETDASDYVITGILSITCSDDEIRLVAFYSHTLTMCYERTKVHCVGWTSLPVSDRTEGNSLRVAEQ